MKQTKYGKTSTFPGNGWRRFDINKATKVDPNNIAAGATDTGGQAGATTLAVNSALDTRLLSQGAFWYIPINLTDTDIATVDVVLDFPDATGGAPATSAADGIYVSGGLTTDPTAMATRAFGMGIEHGGAADIRSYNEQSGAQTFAVGAATGRHFCGTILKSSGVTKKNGCGHILTNTGAFVAGVFHNAVSLTPASASDPIYLFLFVGTAAPVTFSRRVQMFYNISRGYRFS